MNAVKPRRWRVAVSAVVLILGGLAGCASDDMGPDWMTWEQMNQEYRQAASHFPFDLPAGVTFPTEAPWTPDRNGRYGHGYGEMQAYVYSDSVWACVAIASRGTDRDAASRALDAIQQIHGSPGFQSFYYDAGGGWQRMVDRARLGDYTDFIQTYGDRCDG